jgi:proline dehydrogenase
VNPLRSSLTAIAGKDTLRHLVSTARGSRKLVERFVAGETGGDAVATVQRLVGEGLRATVEYLGEPIGGREAAERTVQAYLNLLDRLHAAGLSQAAEVSVDFTAVGGCFDEKLALDNVWRICAAAEQCETTVTLDAPDLDALAELRDTWPWVGAVLKSSLRRTEADMAAVAVPGSRVRLSGGAPSVRSSQTLATGHEVDLAYVRGANQLLAGDGYPMFATHDSRLIGVVTERARWYDRKQGEYEFQMRYGVRPDEQRRLAEEGETVRVHVPFGTEWYGHLVRELTERPTNAVFFLHGLASRK